MERFKRTFSFRKKKDRVPESSKPHQWQEDEKKVRDGTCSFQVRYLGCIEVFESRGIQVCEEAVKALKSKHHRSVWKRMSMRKKKRDSNSEQPEDHVDDKTVAAQCKGKYQRAILYVSGDALRVVDEISKGLIVDQTIEKVSFCAPDRNQEKGFSYICRDGTTRRWMCHGFMAVKETGERLSHAVGCAFAICLERKQKREKESVTVTYNEKGTSFTRMGSFRQTTMTERLADPQSAIIAEPVPTMKAENPHAVQRPHASDSMLERQNSFRAFNKLSDSSPFKRQLSLRMNELPSTLDRQNQVLQNGLHNGGHNGVGTVTPIPEASPTKEQEESISHMCQVMSQRLGALSTDDPFASVPRSAALAAAAAASSSAPSSQQTHTTTVATADPNAVVSQAPSNIPHVQPILQSNPWDGPPGVGLAATPRPPAAAGAPNEAERWLHTATTALSGSPVPGASPSPAAAPVPGATPQSAAAMNGSLQSDLFGQTPMTSPPPASGPTWAGGAAHAQRAPPLGQVRSQSVDTAVLWQQQQQQQLQHQLQQQQLQQQQQQQQPQPQQRTPTLRQLTERGGHVTQFQSQQQTGTAGNNHWGAAGGGGTTSSGATFMNTGPTSLDPFDAAWAAKAAKQNPFQGRPSDGTVTKTFEVNL